MIFVSRVALLQEEVFAERHSFVTVGYLPIIRYGIAYGDAGGARFKSLPCGFYVPNNRASRVFVHVCLYHNLEHLLNYGLIKNRGVLSTVYLPVLKRL